MLDDVTDMIIAIVNFLLRSKMQRGSKFIMIFFLLKPHGKISYIPANALTGEIF